jgi:hypothetical protein
VDNLVVDQWTTGKGNKNQPQDMDDSKNKRTPTTIDNNKEQ